MRIPTSLFSTFLDRKDAPGRAGVPILLTARSFLWAQKGMLSVFGEKGEGDACLSTSPPQRSFQDEEMEMLSWDPLSLPSILTAPSPAWLYIPLVSGEKSSFRNTNDTRKADFITSNANTTDFEVLRIAYDCFLKPPSCHGTLCRALYTYQVPCSLAEGDEGVYGASQIHLSLCSTPLKS